MVRWRCKISGVVQGVGFRPTVYRYATRAELGGWIRNDSDGVTLEVEGPKEAVKAFVRRIEEEPPSLARIDTIEIESIRIVGERDFIIQPSKDSGDKKSPILPDIAVCETCLKEMRDPTDRRFGYPFINCTECGPRYTITKTIPYDRPNTSMAIFGMCDACRMEYEDAASRRYHAQPIACPECGPRLNMRLKNENFKEESANPKDSGINDSLIEKCATLLKEGAIVAVKGLGGFHLMCDATNDKTVERLRKRKRRPDKPFALMVKNLEMAKTLAHVSEKEEHLLMSKESPIVLLKAKATICTHWPSEKVTPGIDRFGVMLPYTPLHHLLFDYLDIPLVATSANLSEEPIVRDCSELVAKLGHVVDAVLDHDRPIENAIDDSVVQVIGDKWVQWLRVARGVAPLNLPVKKPIEKKIMAVGANQKNTIALAFGHNIVLSPHIGDLSGIEPMEYFKRTVATFERFYDFAPEALVHDLHPNYETTKWAKKVSFANRVLPVAVAVQHHYAHVLAVMAEHGVDRKVLAFAWDGTGYGTDDTIWGGEVLLADVEGFERVGHLRSFRLLGGEKAIREPRRVALAMLFEIFSIDEVLAMQNPTVRAFSVSEIRMLHQAWLKGINTPITTSMGRLFDAVASLGGICQRIGYEGESGLLLEAANIDKEVATEKGNCFKCHEDGLVDWEPLIRILAAGEKKSADRFIPALAALVEEIAAQYPDLAIVLTGGVFQNRTLCEMILSRLSNRDLLLPDKAPVNDGAIALGQAWCAIHRE